jgi:DNA replication protein DnaC
MPCKACGRGVKLIVDDLCPASMLAILARMAAHDECAAQARSENNARDAAQRLEVRSQMWETICPSEFKKEIDFTKPGNSPALFQRLGAWEYESGEPKKVNGKGILATGGTGRCKSRYMFKLCERYFKAGRRVVCVSHTTFRRELSYLMREEPRQGVRYMDLLLHADIMFMDDLGKGEITPASEEAFEMLLDKRTSNGKPCFFTSNDNMSTLQRRLSADRGAPIIRRLMDYCEHMNFGG